MARRLVETAQFQRGKDVEAFLDGYYGRRGWQVEVLSADEERGQKLGDRRLVRIRRQVYVEEGIGCSRGEDRRRRTERILLWLTNP
ncbi:MAG: hypothetical protein IT318_23965 [Anaerolineales bacterium]|nr:hypothetical protein [Anaerolineales bacterium]